MQVALEVSPFRPLHPLPLDICSSRPVSTEIQDPDLPSAGLILRLWWLTGSGEALQPLLPWAIPLQFHSFYLTLGQQVVFQKLELQESPLLPTKVAVWPDTRHQTPAGIEPRTCLVKSQRFTTEPSWQPYEYYKFLNKINIYPSCILLCCIYISWIGLICLMQERSKNLWYSSLGHF